MGDYIDQEKDEVSNFEYLQALKEIGIEMKNGRQK